MRLSFVRLHGLITRYVRNMDPALVHELRFELRTVEAALERWACDRDVNVIRTKSGWMPLGEAMMQRASGRFMFMMAPRAENRSNASKARDRCWMDP